MANNKHGQGYNTTGDVARQVPNGGVGSRAAKVPPLPQVQMPTQGPGATLEPLLAGPVSKNGPFLRPRQPAIG